MTDLISRQEVLDALHEARVPSSFEEMGLCEAYKIVRDMPAAKIDGNTSDGYHTFAELYHHRAVLFSVIVRDHMEWCWKAKKHADGTMYDGMFIVGINTPYGQASYHYDIDPYWDMFHCEEYEYAPEWDGHTPQQAIERISKIDMYEVETGEWKHKPHKSECSCSKCGNVEPASRRFCPECGTRMKIVYG